jgi:hypothetical protein
MIGRFALAGYAAAELLPNNLAGYAAAELLPNNAVGISVGLPARSSAMT